MHSDRPLVSRPSRETGDRHAGCRCLTLKQRNRYASRQQQEIHFAGDARIIDTTDNACKLDEAIPLMFVPWHPALRVVERRIRRQRRSSAARQLSTVSKAEGALFSVLEAGVLGPLRRQRTGKALRPFLQKIYDGLGPSEA